MVLVTFLLTTAEGQQVFTKVEISLTCPVFNYSGSLVTMDSIFIHSTQPYVNVDLVPSIYKCRCYGKNCDSQFYINATSSLDYTTQSAADLIYEPCFENND